MREAGLRAVARGSCTQVNVRIAFEKKRTRDFHPGFRMAATA